ncbi:PEP/pyruvate-binding domain-containing protein [Microbacterium rhizosphaerae]|uniref:Phosphoenolpyruvate synthase n=1 Tax=Microbacterium rhizosphaerae TaxID=1678237 RepID=A0ABZ0SQL4_9MICO|nr:PEP/pyruvate-binding domain-containing protein [Microbacterium rhizosphaerae]WPR90108.1 PEP/pyruvate-binding domain-containing protein [Microbacterium rhizosphaerae]
MSERLFIRFFDEAGPAPIEMLGGKCASLVALTTAGMPVPPGFAITTDAYTAFIETSGIADDIHALLATIDPADVDSIDAVSAQIRAEILQRPVPPAIHDEFTAAYADLQSRFDAETPVAVRSSATAEDLPDASFAGQQDTYLWLVGREEVAEHVRRCWASLYTSRAIVYRLRARIPNEGLSMAVAVQKMVDAKAAGVAMTIDPSNGDRSTIVIDAAWGLGELVVSGLVTPDNLHVDKVMLTISAEHLGDKHIELVPDASARRIIEREVEPERRSIRSLTDAEVTLVAAMAKRAEKHFGSPQDIEWAIDRGLPDGENLLLLQSRPETVWASKESTAAATTSGFGIASITQSLMAQIGR